MSFWWILETITLRYKFAEGLILQPNEKTSKCAKLVLTDYSDDASSGLIRANVAFYQVFDLRWWTR